MDTLIKNARVITCEDNNVIEDAYIGIKNGIIEFVGKASDIDKINAKKVIDAKGKIVMPGLVNSHTHAAMTLFRNFASDIPLEEWLFKKIFPLEAKFTPNDVYFGTMLGIAEMIKGGTTTFADMYYYMDDVAKVVSDTGIRANLSKSVLSLNRDGVASASGNIDDAKRYFNKWNNACNGRIKVYVEIHSAYIYDEPSLREASMLAKELNTGIHIHVAETKVEQNTCREKYGMDAVSILDKCGVFDVPVLAAHCVHLSDDNIALLKEKDVNVAHNITSNLKLGSGIARIPDMQNEGINICLGTDGCASNDNLNMFEEMHLTALVHKGVLCDSTVVKAKDVIRMATKNGAKALGFSNLGTIQKGAKADIIILNADNVYNVPNGDSILGVTYSSQASDVETVMVDGNILMENKQLLTIDEERVKYEAKKIRERLIV